MSRPSRLALIRDTKFMRQRTREVFAAAFDRREVVHFLHIGKNAGSHVWRIAAAANRSQTNLRFLKHSHDTKLTDLPSDGRYFFSIRHPVSRFVSAFYERKGKPVNWSVHEQKAFERFEHAADLADALLDEGPAGQAAMKAITSISHTSMNQRDWFDRAGHFLEVRPPVHIVRVEALEADMAALFEKLGVPQGAQGASGQTREGSYRSASIPELTPEGRRNVECWYAQDVALYQVSSRWIDDQDGILTE